MRQLLDNPILKSNPGCLGGLLESVVQGHFQDGASGSVASQDGASGSKAPLKPGDAPMYVRPAAAEPVEPGHVETPGKVDEYKQFWKKFEVPRSGVATPCTDLVLWKEATPAASDEAQPMKVVAAAAVPSEAAVAAVAVPSEAAVAAVAVPSEAAVAAVAVPSEAAVAAPDKVNSPSAEDVANALARQNTIDFPASNGSDGKMQVFAALPTSPPPEQAPVVVGAPVQPPPHSPPQPQTPPVVPGVGVSPADVIPTPTSPGSVAETPDAAADAGDDEDLDALRALKNAYMRFYRSIKSACAH